MRLSGLLPLLRLCDGSFRRAERDETELVLLTPSIKGNQELAVVVKYLRDHPETWHYSAWTDIGVALAMAFPCK